MRKRLLLVEDDATLARAIGRLLRRTGYDVFLAGTCDEARRASGNFSLGVFDVDLPDGDGIDLAEELTKKAVVRRSIFFSGTSDPARRAAATKVGPFIDKGKGFPVLRAAIELVLTNQYEKVVGADNVIRGDSSTPPPSGVRANGKSDE